jgi:hypothetical protein
MNGLKLVELTGIMADALYPERTHPTAGEN